METLKDIFVRGILSLVVEFEKQTGSDVRSIKFRREPITINSDSVQKTVITLTELEMT